MTEKETLDRAQERYDHMDEEDAYPEIDFADDDFDYEYDVFTDD